MEVILAHQLNKNNFVDVCSASGSRLPHPHHSPRNGKRVLLPLPPGEGWGGGAQHDARITIKVSSLPGVARLLVTFFFFAKKKVTKDNIVAVQANLQVMPELKAIPICHLCEVPCVVGYDITLRLVSTATCRNAASCRLARLPHKLARSASRPRAQTYSSEFPDHTPLLGGRRGEGNTSSVVIDHAD
jgi:hypothetical protein